MPTMRIFSEAAAAAGTPLRFLSSFSMHASLSFYLREANPTAFQLQIHLRRRRKITLAPEQRDVLIILSPQSKGEIANA